MTQPLSLPDEVFIAILGLVDIRVLVRCRQVYIPDHSAETAYHLAQLP
jgi:hypothetical protein